MKALALAIMLMAGAVWADDMDRYPPPGPDGRIPMTPGDLMMPPKVFRDTPETRERLIREWAASGEVCRVLGHRWVTLTTYNHNEIYIDEFDAANRTPIVKRKCSVCKRTETKEEVWK